MSDTSGPMWPQPLARWDRDSSSWRTSPDTSLWDLPMSLGTLPRWGMTHGGELFELPMPALPTVAPASSSLPTPTARDWKEQSPTFYYRDGVLQEDLLPRAIWALTQEALALLPTPRAQNGEERNAHPWIRPLDQPQNLENAVARIGAATPPPSDAGSASSDDQHQPPLFPAGTGDPDSPPASSSG